MVQSDTGAPDGDFVPPPLLTPFHAGTALVLGLLLDIVLYAFIENEFLLLATSLLPSLLLASYFAHKAGVPGERVFPLGPVPASGLKRLVLLMMSLQVLEVGLYTVVDLISKGSFSTWAGSFPTSTEGLTVLQTVAATVIAAPLAEELLFRGFFFRCFSSWNRGWAVIVPSLIFAIPHHPLGAPGAFIAGVVFAMARDRYGTIRGGIIAHAAGNGLMTLMASIGSGLSAKVQIVMVAVAQVGAIAVVITQRRHILEGWKVFKGLWRELTGPPQFVVRVKSLLSNWSYILLIIFVLLVLASVLFLPGLEPDAMEHAFSAGGF